jgi:hypothetical protein
MLKSTDYIVTDAVDACFMKIASATCC